MARSRISRGWSVSTSASICWTADQSGAYGKELLLIEPRPGDRFCQSVRAPPLSGGVTQERSQCRDHVGCRDARPATLSLGGDIVVDIARRQVFELATGLRAPPKESHGRTAPLLHRRWCEAALVAHPGDVSVEFAPVQKRDRGFPPPAKKPQPWSPDIDDPPRCGCRPVKVLPLQRNLHQLRHADAEVGVRTETSRDPSEFVALDL